MKNNIKACFTSNCQDWSTPKNIYEHFINNGYIDPCPLHSDVIINSLDWRVKKYFINPPFNELAKWCDMIVDYLRSGLNKHVVLLMPLRFDTKYFKKIFAFSTGIYVFDKRLKFGNSGKSAPFPSCLVYLSSNKKLFPNLCSISLITEELLFCEQVRY